MNPTPPTRRAQDATGPSRPQRFPGTVCRSPRRITGEPLDLIALLADALERIAEVSSDPNARETAEDALAIFQGR